MLNVGALTSSERSGLHLELGTREQTFGCVSMWGCVESAHRNCHVHTPHTMIGWSHLSPLTLTVSSLSEVLIFDGKGSLRTQTRDDRTKGHLPATATTCSPLLGSSTGTSSSQDKLPRGRGGHVWPYLLIMSQDYTFHLRHIQCVGKFGGRIAPNY